MKTPAVACVCVNYMRAVPEINDWDAEMIRRMVDHVFRHCEEQSFQDNIPFVDLVRQAPFALQPLFWEGHNFKLSRSEWADFDYEQLLAVVTQVKRWFNRETVDTVDSFIWAIQSVLRNMEVPERRVLAMNIYRFVKEDYS